jgi:hypothetical protein
MRSAAAALQSAPAKRGRGTVLRSRTVEGALLISSYAAATIPQHAPSTMLCMVPLPRSAALRGGG